MTVGYCRVCGRLVSIQPRELKHPDGRERNWYPVPHPEVGEQCKGEAKPL